MMRFRPFFFLCFLTLILKPFGVESIGQVPDTAAGKRLAELIECVNEKDSQRRSGFLKQGFADESEFEERLAIAEQVHLQMAPLAVEEIIESEALKVIAHCKSGSGMVLQFEIVVSDDDENLITEIGMQPITDPATQSLPEGVLPLFDENRETAGIARGIWRAEGYGYIFEIKKDSLQVYNVTKNRGWKQGFDADLLVREMGDGLNITFHPLEPGYQLKRLEALPDLCQKEIDWTPPELFEAYVELFEVHYPFFSVREVDWAKRAEQIRPTISEGTTDLELFEAMAKMIKDLDDGHVGLSAMIDNESHSARTGGEDTYSRLRLAHRESGQDSTFGNYVNEWEQRLRKSIVDRTLGGEGKEVAGGRIIWGRAHSRIGYLYIDGMGGYAVGDTDTQLKVLHQTLNEVLKELSDTDAIIIDISFNGGGSDLFSIEIASHFADQERVGFSKWPARHKIYQQTRSVTPIRDSQEDAVNYSKPVYLVTNDVTASAAEIFTMCMRAMPNVTTIGLPTEGALSDILSKSLPNGWSLGLSNEVYVDHLGVCYEGPGVPPEIRMEIFDSADISKIGHAESIEKIIRLAIENVDSK